MEHLLEHTAWRALSDCLASTILLCRKGVCVPALNSERCCRPHDKFGGQTLPPAVAETQKLEKRRRDKLVLKPRKARSGGSESAEDVLQNAHVRNLVDDRAQAGHQLEYQSCCNKDGRKATR